MGRRNIMTGTSEQFQYILRDESMHLNFGVDLVNAIIAENPHLWTDELKAQISQLIDEGVTLSTVMLKRLCQMVFLDLTKKCSKNTYILLVIDDFLKLVCQNYTLVLKIHLSG